MHRAWIKSCLLSVVLRCVFIYTVRVSFSVIMVAACLMCGFPPAPPTLIQKTFNHYAVLCNAWLFVVSLPTRSFHSERIPARATFMLLGSNVMGEVKFFVWANVDSIIQWGEWMDNNFKTKWKLSLGGMARVRWTLWWCINQHGVIFFHSLHSHSLREKFSLMFSILFTDVRPPTARAKSLH